MTSQQNGFSVGCSADAKARTRAALALEDAAFTHEGLMCLKHLDGRFATASADDLLRGRIRIVDRDSDCTLTFADADGLIANGWVVD